MMQGSMPANSDSAFLRHMEIASRRPPLLFRRKEEMESSHLRRCVSLNPTLRLRASHRGLDDDLQAVTAQWK